MYSSYSTINMNTMPGEMKLKGKNLMAQALNVNYQDIPRDIQIMRDQTYDKEVKEGEFVPEFGSFGDTAIFAFAFNILVLGLAIYGGFCLYQNYGHRISFASKKRKK